MGYFAGLDVSLEETAICIVDGAGKIVREARAASEPEALVAFFGGCGLAIERVGLEACSLTAWLHGGLTEAGLPAICIEARQAKAAMAAMPNKTDCNDARGIAQIMRTGWYRAVHVKSPPCRAWRTLLTARRLLLNKRRDVENGVRALLREAGLKLGTPSRKDFPVRTRGLAAGDPVLEALAEPLLSVIEAMNIQAEALTKQVITEVKEEPACRKLMTVPGVGPLTALAFRATVDQPGRFRRSRDVGAHFGLPQWPEAASEPGPADAGPGLPRQAAASRGSLNPAGRRLPSRRLLLRKIRPPLRPGRGRSRTSRQAPDALVPGRSRAEGH